MNWLVYHIVSGQAFFTGVSLLMIASLSSLISRPIYKRVTVLAFLIGVIAIVVSSTPIPYWLYAVATLITLTWIASCYGKSWRRWTPYANMAIWTIAALFEMPYHVTYSLNRTEGRSVAVIGDSVTAGVGGDEKSETWPSILGREHRLQIEDISHVGETAASALKRLKSHSISAHVVVVEIGGNDILGSTTANQFASDLDELLGYLAAENRQIVMFELPLPPFCHEYGRLQRAVAAKHNVRLVPKRIFLSVIAGSDSTLDTIHLSQAGHQRMADCVWRLVNSAFSANSSASEAKD